MRTARLQYGLLILATVASLTYYAASVSATLMEVYGDQVPGHPTFHGYRLDVVSGLAPEAANAGIHWGDRVLAINGRPFSGYNVYLEELRKSHAANVMQLTIQPQVPAGGQPVAPHTVAVHLAPVYSARPRVLQLITQIYFLGVLLPLACLALGVWVVAARPRDRNAWFLFGILQYFVIIFGSNQLWPGAIYAFVGVWSMIGTVTTVSFQPASEGEGGIAGAR